MNAVHVSVVDGETEVLLGEEVSPLTVRVAERAFRKALREEGLTAGEGEVVLLEREVRVYLQGLEVVWEKRGRPQVLEVGGEPLPLPGTEALAPRKGLSLGFRYWRRPPLQERVHLLGEKGLYEPRRPEAQEALQALPGLLEEALRERFEKEGKKVARFTEVEVSGTLRDGVLLAPEGRARALVVEEFPEFRPSEPRREKTYALEGLAGT